VRENSADGSVIKEEAYLDFDDLLFTSFELFLTVIKMHHYQTTILCAGHPYNTILLYSSICTTLCIKDIIWQEFTEWRDTLLPTYLHTYL